MMRLYNTLHAFRANLGDLLAYDTMICPLVYTQVVPLVVWMYSHGQKYCIKVTQFTKLLAANY